MNFFKGGDTEFEFPNSKINLNPGGINEALIPCISIRTANRLLEERSETFDLYKNGRQYVCRLINLGPIEDSPEKIIEDLISFGDSHPLTAKSGGVPVNFYERAKALHQTSPLEKTKQNQGDIK